MHTKTLEQARTILRSGELSSEEMTRAVLDAAARDNDRLGAYITLTEERALEDARRADARFREAASGDELPSLLGIPLAIKDNICTEGVRTTAASRMLSTFVPPYDATVSSLLFHQQGAVLVGKTNLDEFAMGSSTEHSHFGLCRNPWNLDRAPGGSSGGSAAAVAADLCIAALGSDTGGSIRQPASFCGVVGLKPTYGRVSRYGLIAFASSLDQIGPLAKTVTDAAILLGAIAGHDPKDSTSARNEVPDFEGSCSTGARGLRIGIPREYFVDGMDGEVELAVRAAAAVFEAQGALVKEVSLPRTEYAVATYYLLATSEASSNLARYDGVHYGLRSNADNLIDLYRASRAEGFGAEVKRRIMLGTFALSSGYYDAYYRKAQQARALICEDFRNVFEEVDLVLSPTAPSPAFGLGEKQDNPLEMYLSDILTIPGNLAGLPGISLPCGFTAAGLPIGLQLQGKPFEEAVVLGAARAFEHATEWHRRRPGGGEGARR